VNPLYERIEKGTVGELIVQLRLLEHGIQAAPPLRDSGNDLIAIRGEVIRAIQVKTTYRDRFTKLGDLRRKRYHILALVAVTVEGDSLLLDRSDIYLLSKDAVTKSSYSVKEVQPYMLSDELLNHLFCGPE
jgi:hypothetical protein